ncbi:hypothetical protein LTR78_003802 [Recurvomyces mirabilis]|uniref:Uncharacterized protein n=1 Tax=Recurvomyces mirabilis TaxID=574656 RepID=A0AAE1C395_9PEZI|nr:hypothetical protein LTR78_003802 [Recurvomyces mirabilis]KAK5154914.1 hypothetical protein LTS14_006495 [Recurvomyces mirabilis]
MGTLQAIRHEKLSLSANSGSVQSRHSGLKSFDLEATHVKSSPYDDLTNHLTLRNLDAHSRLFAISLTSLEPVREDYATTPWPEAFNWPTVFTRLRALCQISGVKWQKREFYVVTFRSVRKRNADVDLVSGLDQQSHREACESGGLLKYWFGSCDSEMRNLATCIWRCQEDAIAGGSGPWHRRARMASKDLYEHIDFRTHKLVVDDNATSWRLEDYTQV